MRCHCTAVKLVKAHSDDNPHSRYAHSKAFDNEFFPPAQCLVLVRSWMTGNRLINIKYTCTIDFVGSLLKLSEYKGLAYGLFSLVNLFTNRWQDMMDTIIELNRGAPIPCDLSDTREDAMSHPHPNLV
jgi:hypothetical protein